MSERNFRLAAPPLRGIKTSEEEDGRGRTMAGGINRRVTRRGTKRYLNVLIKLLSPTQVNGSREGGILRAIYRALPDEGGGGEGGGVSPSIVQTQ